MNYKQMLLLEKLVNRIDEKGTYKISFMMDNVLCTGDFGHSEVNFSSQEGIEQEAVQTESLIDTNKLWKDYQIFIGEDKDYFLELSEHLLETNDDRGDKALMAVFNNMVVFLMDKVNSLDDYLMADGIPEVVYHFYKYDKYYAKYAVNGAHMEPLTIFKKEQ